MRVCSLGTLGGLDAVLDVPRVQVYYVDGGVAVEAHARMRLGAGCGSPCCSHGQGVTRFNAQQHEVARRLLTGASILVEWPEDAEDCDVWRRPAEAMEKAAARALARGTGPSAAP